MIGKIVFTNNEKKFTVTFNTTPQEATITLRDSEGQIVAPKEGKTYKLKAGTYTYDVTAEGYYSLTNQVIGIAEDTTIQVQALDKILYVSFSLTPSTATIVLKDNDGNVINAEAGTTNKFKIKKGAYKYSVSADGYYPINDVVFSMTDNDVNKTITVKLDKKLYAIFVLTPTDATLTVKDGSGQVLVPQTGHTYEVKAGMYSYSVTHASGAYKPIENVAFEMTEAEVNKTINVSLMAKTYGVRRQIGITSSAWERIGDSVGLVVQDATKDGSLNVRNDFDNIPPWSNIRSCDISANGVVNAYIGDPTYDPVNPKGYIMTEFPEFWWKREQTGGYEYIYISAVQQAGFTKSQKFYLSRYLVTGSRDVPSSKSGAYLVGSFSYDTSQTTARSIGAKWYNIDILRWSMLQLLYLVEYADYNGRGKIGLGYISRGQILGNRKCGTLDNLLMKSGCNTNTVVSPIIYRGVEEVWGPDIYLGGVTRKANDAWVCYNPEQDKKYSMSSPYQKLSYSIYGSQSTINNFGKVIKSVGYDPNNPAIQLETDISTANTGEDYLYTTSVSNYSSVYSNTFTASFCILTGGSAGGSDNNGGNFWRTKYYDSSGSAIGLRLMYLPA